MDPTLAKAMTKELKGYKLQGWKLEKYLGHGYSAVVFRATKGKDRAAIKVFDRALVEKFGYENQLERVKRELILVGKHHPNLVRILGGGEDKSKRLLYVIMEYIADPPLSKIFKKVPPRNIGPIIRQLAGASKFLEDEGTAHRDIKVDNMALSKDFKHVTLLDLGVLRPIAEQSHVTDGDWKPVIATKQYCPPEYLYRKEEDTPEGWRAITFYQIGGVLYDLINRRRLFEKEASVEAELYDAIRTLVPSVKSSRVPPELRLLASACLQKDPRMRIAMVQWASFEYDFEALSSDEKAARSDLLGKLRAASTLGNTSPTASTEYETRTVNEYAVQELANKVLFELRAFPELPPIDTKTSYEANAKSGILHLGFTFGVGALKGFGFYADVKVLVDPRNSERSSVSLLHGWTSQGQKLTDNNVEELVHSGPWASAAVGDKLAKRMLQVIGSTWPAP